MRKMKNQKLINSLQILIVLALLLSNISIRAQEQNIEKFAGNWERGDVTFSSYKPTLVAADKNDYLRLEFAITVDNGNLKAKMKSPDSNVLWMDADDVVAANDTIKLSFNAIKGIFLGVLNEDKTQIVGSLNFLGKMIPMGLEKVE